MLRAREKGEGKLVCSDYRVSVLQNEKVLENCCQTMWTYVTTEFYT